MGENRVSVGTFHKGEPVVNFEALSDVLSKMMSEATDPLTASPSASTANVAAANAVGAVAPPPSGTEPAETKSSSTEGPDSPGHSTTSSPIPMMMPASPYHKVSLSTNLHYYEVGIEHPPKGCVNVATKHFILQSKLQVSEQNLSVKHCIVQRSIMRWLGYVT